MAGGAEPNPNFMVTDSKAFPLRANTKGPVKQVSFHCAIDFHGAGHKGERVWGRVISCALIKGKTAGPLKTGTRVGSDSLPWNSLEVTQE